MMSFVYVKVPVILTRPSATAGAGAEVGAWAEVGTGTAVGIGAAVGAAAVGLSGGREVGASERRAERIKGLIDQVQRSQADVL